MKVTYLSEIEYVLSQMGGMASLNEINDLIQERGILPAILTNPNWKDNIRATIQRHSSDTKSYNGSSDLFYSVYGLGEGYWGLRSYDVKFEGLNPIENRAISNIENDRHINSTEKEMLIKARKGQGVFREKMLNKYHKCIITGITDSRLLIASHIKPWRASDNIERLSSENGILLSPLYDKLFDIGLISFNDEMQIRISSELNRNDIDIIDFDLKKKFIINPSDELISNMKYHRSKIFVR